ncbi:MAG: hypothetical protein C4536_14010 [Actinobacteria bacterium]|nr:MAG: hypothetical protein C4536_14010 [Actinomycetota bacterium]
MEKTFKHSLFKIIEILGEYLSEVVFAGGWAPLIFYHYLIGDKTRTPLLTQEFDLMVGRRIRSRGISLNELLRDAGLHPEPRDSSPHPAQIYSGEIKGNHLELEFFAPMTGRGGDRAIEVQDNLLALPLRYADIIVSAAMEVVIDDHPLHSVTTPVTLLVPSPGAFIFNKGLTFSRRQAASKEDKDLYYIFDILARCPELRQEILEEIGTLKRSSATHVKWFRSFLKNMADYFGDPDAKGINMVFRQRPSNAFPGLDDQQFRQYVFEIFKEFIEELDL